jgi:hypothetical protein
MAFEILNFLLWRLFVLGLSSYFSATSLHGLKHSRVRCAWQGDGLLYY